MTPCQNECFRAQKVAQVESLLAQCPQDETPRYEKLGALLAKLAMTPCTQFCDNQNATH
ncbi:MAG: hypothetical protein PHS32_12120 [Rhodoferax sp.]|uniref:hypothetical protein n=1 Tax=Rhodoferax sp. TaxID=50421 RepID=UPI002601EB20|nr:hypothetical protein [Rhodoferax sp.]MDD5334478.1 hypothetical protein [Rhodoferax sp.]